MVIHLTSKTIQYSTHGLRCLGWTRPYVGRGPPDPLSLWVWASSSGGIWAGAPALIPLRDCAAVKTYRHRHHYYNNWVQSIKHKYKFNFNVNTYRHDGGPPPLRPGHRHYYHILIFFALGFNRFLQHTHTHTHTHDYITWLRINELVFHLIHTSIWSI